MIQANRTMRNLIGMALAAITPSAEAAYKIVPTSVSVTCTVSAKRVTKEWDKVGQKETALATAAIEILRSDPQFDYWHFVAGAAREEARVEILFFEEPEFQINGKVSLRIGTASVVDLASVPVWPAADIKARGLQPGFENDLKSKLTELFGPDRRKALLPPLRKRVPVGHGAFWNGEPPEFAVPVYWRDNFKRYAGVFRAGSRTDDTYRYVFGVSLDRSVAAEDEKRVRQKALLAKANCAYDGSAARPASLVDDLENFKLHPVYVVYTDDEPDVPFLRPCTVKLLELE